MLTGAGWSEAWGRLLLCVLVGVLAPVTAIRAESTPPAKFAPRVMVQEVPPFVYNRRGKPEGFIPDVLDALAAQLNLSHPLSIEFAPLPRAAELLRKNPNLVFAPMARVAANENDFKWLRPLLTNRIFAVRRAVPTPMPADLEALKSARRLAVASGGGHQAMAEEMGFRNLLLVRSQTDAFRRMMAGEAEFCVLSELAMRSILEADKVPLDAVQSTGFALGNTEVHLAFSPSIAPQELARWHAALEQLRRSGRLEALAKQHFGPGVQVPK